MGGGGGEGGEKSNLSSMDHVWGRGGGNQIFHLSIMCWGGEGGGIMMGSPVDQKRGVGWVNFANQMDYSEIDETGRDFPRSEFIRKVESPMFH